MIKKIFVFFILIFSAIFICFNVNAQQYITKYQFNNVENNLFKNNNVKSVYYASNGIIYFATEKGLFGLYNNKIKELQLPNNVDKVITSIIGYQNKLIIGTNKGLVFYDLLENEFTKINLIDNKNKIFDNYIQVVQVDQKQNLLYYTGYDTSAYYLYNIATKKNTFLFNRADGFRAIEKDNDNNIKTLWIVEQTGLTSIQLNNYKVVKKLFYFNGNNNMPNLSVYNCIIKNDILWCATNEGLLQFNKKTLAYKLYIIPNNNKTVNSVVLYNNTIFCGSNNGLYIFAIDKLQFTKNIHHIADDNFSLLNNAITNLFLLHNNTLIVTNDKGISTTSLHYNNNFVFEYASNNKIDYVLFTKKIDSIHVVQTSNAIFFNSPKKSVIVAAKNNLPFKDIIAYKSAFYAITNNAVYKIENNKINKIKPLQKIVDINFISLHNTTVTIGSSSGIFEIKNDKITPFVASANEPYQNYQYNIPNTTYYIANTYFSYVDIYQPVANKKLERKGIIETFANINDYYYLDSTNILIATTAGLKKINFTNLQYHNIDSNFKKEILKIVVTNKDTLLVTNDGMYNLFNNKIINLNIAATNLFSTINNNISYNNNSIQYIYNGALYSININDSLLNTTNINFIPQVFFKNKPINEVLQIHIDDPLQIEIITNNLNPHINYTYYYKINNNTNWIAVEDFKINLDRLQQGKYKIYIKGSIGNYTYYNKTITLHIKGNWYNSLWFIVFLLILAIIFTIWIFKKLLNKQKAKAKATLQLQQQLNSLEAQALRAQMNPHFLFNTLNSINNFILTNKNDDASNYLIQFSKLVRLILDNSVKEKISLTTELETLQLYVQLEQMRKNNAFKLIIKNEIKQEDEINIPPLILQPLVENAIWHGFANKTKDGIIFISIKKQNEFISINILDNGKGYMPSNKSNSSFGLAGTKQRLLIENINNTISIKLRTNKNKIAKGTAVNINLITE